MKKISYQLNKAENVPLYLQLYQQIRAAILQQELTLGDKLPSKRYLSEHLQISQNTIESAYQQLIAEGYIESKSRSGFYVSFHAELDFSFAKPKQQKNKRQTNEIYDYDLNPNLIDYHHFPIQKWQKAGKLSLVAWQNEIMKLGHKQGELLLRQQIAEYLFASRGVNCEPEQIIIGTGAENCVSNLILLFNQCSEQPLVYGMEPYGYATVAKLLQSYGKKVENIPFKENGLLDTDFLSRSSIDIAYLTPSNLYPFSQVLSISERQQLLEWANQQPQRYIIEDDYDSEFRYKGKPIPALQSLDQHQKVIYLGSFSKLVMPSLRIGFMVLPKPLLADYQRFCGFLNCGVSRFEQFRLANFIQQGEFEKHIQRMRKVYRRKMELLCELLQPFQPEIRYYGEHSGFHLLIELSHSQKSSEEIVQQCLSEKIKIYPIIYPNKQLFSLGFANLTESQLQEVAQKLIRILLGKA